MIMPIYDFLSFSIIGVPFPPPPLARPCPSPRGSATSTLRQTITLTTAEGGGLQRLLPMVADFDPTGRRYGKLLRRLPNYKSHCSFSLQWLKVILLFS